jgi:hypothetical protein
MAPANNSGRSVAARPTVMPPAEVPLMVSSCGVVQPAAISCCAQAMRSRQVLGLLASLPPSRQASPSSPPPRT